MWLTSWLPVRVRSMCMVYNIIKTIWLCFTHILLLAPAVQAVLYYIGNATKSAKTKKYGPVVQWMNAPIIPNKNFCHYHLENYNVINMHLNRMKLSSTSKIQEFKFQFCTRDYMLWRSTYSTASNSKDNLETQNKLA